MDLRVFPEELDVGFYFARRARNMRTMPETNATALPADAAPISGVATDTAIA